jgi:DNA-binding MarR family transcriptional regulator
MVYTAGMAITDLQDSINWLLIRSSLIAKQRLMKISEQHDLSPMQALTLCLLEPGDMVPMSMISDLLACDASNVTGIVERLSVGDYIERRELKSDRRVKTISLTPTGNALRKELVNGIVENGAENLEALTPHESELLKGMLRKLLPVSHSKHFQPTAQ